MLLEPYLESAVASSDKIWTYDSNGIPYYNYRSPIGPQINPLFVAQEVLYHLADYNKTGDETSRKVALNNANWLVNNAQQRGNYSILNYNFSFPSYAIDPPWHSAIAQAKAAEALVTAYQSTKNQTYLDTAKSLVNSFFAEIKDGGVAFKTPNSGWWYESFAKDNTTDTPRVLSGMIQSILSIYEYYRHTNDTNAIVLLNQGLRALRTYLPFYDSNSGYSYYDIYKGQSPSYHNINVALLKKLLNIVDDEIIRNYYDKWSRNQAMTGLRTPYGLPIP